MTKERKFEFLLASVMLARSSSFVISKMALNSLSPFNLLALRFIIAFLLLSVLCWKRLRNIERDELRGGILLGILFSVVMSMEMLGLQRTDTATTSFVENSAIIFVPLLLMIINRRLPSKMEFLQILLAMTGIGFLTLSGSGGILKTGTIYLILAALFYALTIVETERVAKKGDALVIGIVQIGTLGFVTMCISLLTESPRIPDSAAEWEMILLLALVCSGFGFVFQTVAQKEVPADRAGSMCAINPLGAALMGVIFLRESLGSEKLIGCALILISLIIEPIMIMHQNRAKNTLPVARRAGDI